MSSWNLALRFGLELTALVGLGAATWRYASGLGRWVGVIAVPLAAAVVWGTFNVPDDPSRSGAAPVVVPGSARLAIELLILGGGAVALALAWRREAGIALAALLAFHYAMSMPRIQWLLES